MNNNNNTKPFNKKNPKHLINEAIPFAEVLLVYDDNSSEKLNLTDAINKAKNEQKDLILINDKVELPIVKIYDHGKFLYSLKHKTKNSKKNVSKTKSITFKPKIDNHDLQWKANKVIEWLKMGDRVQFIIRAGGRMSSRTDLIKNVFEKFTTMVSSYGTPNGPLKKSSNIHYEVYFVPIKGTSSAGSENKSTDVPKSQTVDETTSTVETSTSEAKKT